LGIALPEGGNFLILSGKRRKNRLLRFRKSLFRIAKKYFQIFLEFPVRFRLPVNSLGMLAHITAGHGMIFCVRVCFAGFFFTEIIRKKQKTGQRLSRVSTRERGFSALPVPNGAYIYTKSFCRNFLCYFRLLRYFRLWRYFVDSACGCSKE